MGKNDRYVTRHPVGWSVQKPGPERASSIHDTQRAAKQRANEIVGNLGG